MPNEKAEEIIRRAMADPDVYRSMAEKEAAVWSRTLTNPQTKQALEADQKAANELGVNRNRITLARVLAKHKLKPASGLSLGCGAGRAERNLIEAGICSRFHGIDIAPDAVADAERIAAEQELPITYEVQDLNFVSLPENAYDLVVAQTSLHHLLRLEHVADEINKSLTADGVLWVHEYIGESQFQYSDERLRIVNDLVGLLPPDLRFNHLKGQVYNGIRRKQPGTLVSPFESIRSGEIRQIFLDRFDIVEKVETDALMARVVIKGTRRNYLKDENTRALFEVLVYLDRLLIETGVLPPMSGQYLLRKRRA